MKQKVRVKREDLEKALGYSPKQVLRFGLVGRDQQHSEAPLFPDTIEVEGEV